MIQKLNRIEIFVVAIVVLIYIVLIIFSPNGFWILDEGNKFLWASNFIKKGALILPNRAEEISPGHSAFKIPFSIPYNDGKGQITTFSPIFITLISPLVKIGSMKGAMLLPLIASICLIFGLRKMALKLGFPFEWYTILILGIASPLLFYSVTIWEHSLAILLGIVAVNLSLPAERNNRDKVLAGTLMAVSIYIRPEMAIFALGMWIFLIKDKISALLGFSGGLLLMMVLNWFAMKSLLPLQITANFALKWGETNPGNFLLSRIDAFYALLLQTHHLWYLSAGIILAAGMFLYLPGIFKFVFPFSLILLITVTFFDREPFFHIGQQSSLLFTAPLFFFSIFEKSESQAEKALRKSVWLILLLSIMFTPVFRGIHYGPRILLPLIPLLAILSTVYLKRVYKSQNVFKFDALLFIILAQILVTIWGIDLLYARRNANQKRSEIIMQQSQNAIVTLQWWLQQEMPQLYFSKDLYMVETPLELKKMLIDYYRKGVRFFTVLTTEDSSMTGSSQDILQIIALSPPKQIGYFEVKTGYSSMDLLGLQYAIGFDVEGAAKLADELGVYYGQMDNLAEAERYLSWATEWDSDVGSYHYNLGYCLGKMGRYEKAYQEIELAHELDPKNATIEKMLKELSEKMGEANQDTVSRGK